MNGEVIIDDNKHLERALRDLKRQLIRNGSFKEMRARIAYQKPSEARKSKSKEAQRRRARARKAARRNRWP